MRAKKEFGQHFLVQEAIAERLATSLDLSNAEAILEIGPGKGILTQFLTKLPLPLFAVELDRDLIPVLQRMFPEDRLHLVQGDILRLRLDEILGANRPFILVGNFPYNISSQIVFLALQHRENIPFMAGMFQKEMAERIISPPGSKNFGVISVLAQAYYHPALLFHVKPGSFNPPPKVNSSVISLKRFRTEIPGVPFNVLRQVVKLAFSQRRKKLRNTLMPILHEDLLKAEGVSDLRPEQLSVDQFIQLARLVVRDQPT